MMKTTDDTQHPGALPQTPKAHQKAVTCENCAQLQPIDAAGWCPARHQYRAINIFRLCDEFRPLKTKEQQ